MNPQDYYLLKAMTGWRDIELREAPIPPAPEGALQSLDEVLHHLDGIRTVTLDVFDTLLRRDVEPSDFPQRAAMQQLVLPLVRAGMDVSIEELMTLRREAEAQARQDALVHGGDAECSLGEIFTQLYRDIETRYGIDLADTLAVGKLVDFEVEVETARLSPMPGAADLLEALHRRGIRVLLLSDMYLEDAHLRRILAQHGLLDRVDEIHVSSHTRLSKGSGSIFRRLINNKTLVVGESLHVGDHPVSDVQRPREQGLHALLFHSIAERQRRSRLRQAMKLAERFGDTGPLLRESGQTRPDAALGDPYQIGYHRLGPVFTLFALDLLRDALRNDYREIYFLARDGFLLQQLYEQLRDGLDMSRLLPTPRGRYLYLSRASTRLAELGDSPEVLSSLAQRVNRQDGVWSLIAILGFDREAYRPLVERILDGEDLDQALDESGELQQRLLADSAFRQRLRDDIAAGKSRLRDYLIQEEVLTPGRILMVDIGWNGSILATLQKAFGKEPAFPDIRARLFGRLYGSSVEGIDVAPGFAYDARRDNPIEHLINECRELFESVSSSFEGSVLGYMEKQGRLAPRCADSSLDERNRQLVAALQQGVRDYCADFIKLYNRFSPNPSALHADSVLQATSLIAGTRPEEQACLAELQFDLSWGTEGRVSLREYMGFSGTQHTQQQPIVQSSQPLQVQLGDSHGNSSQDVQKLFEHLHQLIGRLRQEDSLVIYGVGTVASLLAPLLQDRIAYFVDGNAALHGQQFLGRNIRSPDVLREDRQHCVFVTPLGRKSVIAKRLGGLGQTLLYIDDFI